MRSDVHYTTQTPDFFGGVELSRDTRHQLVITHSNVTNTTVLYLDGASVDCSAKADYLFIIGTTNRLLMTAMALVSTLILTLVFHYLALLIYIARGFIYQYFSYWLLLTFLKILL